MFRLGVDLKVYLHREPIDFRAGINSLAVLVHCRYREVRDGGACGVSYRFAKPDTARERGSPCLPRCLQAGTFVGSIDSDDRRGAGSRRDRAA